MPINKTKTNESIAQIILWSVKQQNDNSWVYTYTHAHAHMRTVTKKNQPNSDSFCDCVLKGKGNLKLDLSKSSIQNTKRGFSFNSDFQEIAFVERAPGAGKSTGQIL